MMHMELVNDGVQLEMSIFALLDDRVKFAAKQEVAWAQVKRNAEVLRERAAVTNQQLEATESAIRAA